MKENKLINGFSLVVALCMISLPFILDYERDFKIIFSAVGISLLSNYFIKNKKIRYLIAGICLSAILYVAFKL